MRRARNLYMVRRRRAGFAQLPRRRRLTTGCAVGKTTSARHRDADAGLNAQRAFLPAHALPHDNEVSGKVTLHQPHEGRPRRLRQRQPARTTRLAAATAAPFLRTSELNLMAIHLPPKSSRPTTSAASSEDADPEVCRAVGQALGSLAREARKLPSPSAATAACPAELAGA